MLTINQAARRVGLPNKTLRYYDEIGLVSPPARSASGYRLYDEASCRKLAFVRRVRQFDFGIEETRALLDLYDNPRRTSAEVKSIANEKLALLDTKLEQLQCLRSELALLIDACSDDRRHDCPILDHFDLPGSAAAHDDR